MSEDENISLTAHRVQGPSLCPAKTKAEWRWVLMATTSRALLCRQESHRVGRRAVVQAAELFISPALRKALPVIAHRDGKHRTGRHRVAMVAVTKETSRGGKTSSGGTLGQRHSVRLHGQRGALEERLPFLLPCFLR